MLRQVVRGILALILVTLVVDTAVRGQQPTGGDRIYYRDKKDGSIRQVEGELKVVSGSYQVTPVGKTAPSDIVRLSPADIIRAVPLEVPGYDRKSVLDPVAFEEKKDWEKARVAYKEMLDKSASAPDKVRRYLEFRLAYSTARSADEIADDNASQAKAEEGVKFLEQFLSANKSGWEVWPAALACARLQVSLSKKDGDKEGTRLFDEAARTWGKVVKSTDLPLELRVGASLQAADCYIRARRWSEARAAIEDAEKIAPAGPFKDRLGIFKIMLKFGDSATPLDGIAPIETEIAKTKEPSVRATGYGMLGELYLLADKPREAMWQFLWVEVVYNQDRDEVLKTLVRLADSFRLQGDEDRTKVFKDKIKRYRGSL